MNKNIANKIQISLIELSIENFKTLKEKVTFSTSARKSSHTFESNGENLLKTSFIFGPNASGKTSILEAMATIKNLIAFSANINNPLPNQNIPSLPYNPFKGSISTQNSPTTFEIVFSLLNRCEGIYKYNFSYNQDEILSESLSLVNSDTEKNMFTRNSSEIVIHSDTFKDQEVFKSGVRKDSLFLTKSFQNNNMFALDLIIAFNDIWLISGAAGMNTNIDKIKSDSVYRDKILKYLKIADFTITGAKTKEVDVQGFEVKFDSGLPSMSQSLNSKVNTLILEHPVFDEKNTNTQKTFELDMMLESTGTQKFIGYIGFVIDVLESGKVLFIDELDCSLHPKLSKFIIDLFESEEINTNNAQLITTTHDTSLLSYKDDFIKDQFWFTEKNLYGASKLFPLSDFDLRNDTEFSKKYLEGRFGALPFIGSVEK